MYDSEELRITFESSGNTNERSICLSRTFPYGSPRWPDIVPLFKDFLLGMGYVLPSNTEFVLMPIHGSDKDKTT